MISRHFRTGTFWLVTFHGPKRTSNVDSLEKCDIVLTTFNTVASDWDKRAKPQQGSRDIFDIHWRRIVLDEGLDASSHMLSNALLTLSAHIIRNRATKTAQAIYALNAKCRWCITGTPVQNHLRDLANLFWFLRVYPFDDHRVFKHEITQPLISQTDTRALLRLQILVKSIALRRSQAVVALPVRKDEVHYLEMDEEEAALYNRAKTMAVRMIEKAIQWSSGNRSAYFHALQRINQLRMICDQGTMYVDKPQVTKDTRNGDLRTEVREEMGDVVEAMMSSAGQACDRCGIDLEEEVPYYGSQPLSEENDVDLLSQTFQRLCRDCANLGKATSASNSQSPSVAEDSEAEAEILNPDPSMQLPTKIRVLVQDLHSYKQKEKR